VGSLCVTLRGLRGLDVGPHLLVNHGDVAEDRGEVGVVHGALCGLGVAPCPLDLGAEVAESGVLHAGPGRAESDQSLLTMLMGTSVWWKSNNLPEASGRDASAVDSGLHGPFLPERMGIRVSFLLEPPQ
jgi:hypothetical protein